ANVHEPQTRPQTPLIPYPSLSTSPASGPISGLTQHLVFLIALCLARNFYFSDLLGFPEVKPKIFFDQLRAFTYVLLNVHVRHGRWTSLHHQVIKGRPKNCGVIKIDFACRPKYRVTLALMHN